MEILDVREHDPEEYEGKGINIHGCLYRIGPQIGAGHSKIVHVLRNARSGLHLNALAIYRDSDSGRQELGRELAFKALDDLIEGQGVVPSLMEVDLPGGVAYVQDYIGPYEPAPSQDIMAAERLMAAGEWIGAIDVYSRVLETQPDHTVALFNCASALNSTGHPEQAAHLMARAIDIEPNYRAYLHDYVKYCSAAERPTQVMDGWRAITERYPHDTSCQLYVDKVPQQAAALHNRGVQLAAEGHWNEAVALTDRAIESYVRLAEFDHKKVDQELAESLLNYGVFTTAIGNLIGGVQPLLQTMRIAHEYGRHDLYDPAAHAMRQALARDRQTVEQELERLTGGPVPLWFSKPS
ncbi:hypothetical protein CBI38_21255 [Rhodococcus oxybenzonivorans]|uniref:Uncharacterized protein n=1 Tax=Rhodococcus oxybenzonivorans TaxID=1990687 RepID=A0A2S2BYQ3_9NOCA|nr:tetratricopeptide repeat protein [Rhodococcus oxybenzonivorans]AWK73722.1 hypothetical protein CBI38_21255 [Rhodococcus oxybenzonivorans]